MSVKKALPIEHMVIVKVRVITDNLVININIQMTKVLLMKLAGFINARRYQEALNVLDQIKTRNAMWFYYSAIAMNGIGNNITAVEYAQTAAQMEPGNLQYMLLLQQLRGGQRQYQQGQETYGSPFGDPIQCCYSIMMINCLLSCCCF